MATLVFSTVGTVLGGPIGGAIGALIGQSIDQQLLAPATHGPRLGDLAVQTSSYGTQMPRIYGTMRVAGTVVWSTDLVESSQTSGAKGQPDVTYSYSVSLAVALSSRTVGSIGRIWADGKLLRGVDGDFKSSTTFRFYDGSEDQVIDPLIGSVEGIDNTPAYRGLALAVFENFELADFGNRIPFLTFEVVADGAPPPLSAILADASGGAIACGADEEVAGFAAYGDSIRAALEPLVNCYGIDLFDDGSVVRSPVVAAALPISDDQLGNSADGEAAARMKREQAPTRALPASLRLTYYDPARDYQTGEARAAAGEESGPEVQQALPAVLAASDAKALAQRMLARSWASRDRVTLRLPPSSLTLEPGSLVELDLSPALWVAETCTVDAFIPVVTLRPSWEPLASLEGEAGRIVANPDVVEGAMSLAVFDVPDVLGQASSAPTLLLAASTPSSAWKRHAVELNVGGQTLALTTARRKSVLGTVVSLLPASEAYLIDELNSFDVQLIDTDQWLTSCDDDALADGTNFAIVGGELLQFAAATPLSGGQWRLSRLVRGRAGTEWAVDSHQSGEPFCLLTLDSLQRIELPSWSIGSAVTVSSAAGALATSIVNAEALRPPPPIDLVAAPQQGGGFAIGWTRRSRTGWSWTDEVDAPLGETREQYRITVTGTAGTVELETDQPNITVTADDLAAAGLGPATIEVRQVGDWAASRPAQIAITLS